MNRELQPLSVRNMLTGSIKRLAHVFRYSSVPVIRKENVAEHTAFISIFSLLIARDLNSRGDKQVDIGRLLQSALLHDLDESLSGDFLRCVKYGVPGLKDLLDDAGENFMKFIQGQLGVDIFEDWKFAKDSSIEGQIVSVADLMGVVSYLHEELHSGNTHVAHILPEIEKYFKDPEIRSSALSYYVEQTISLISEMKSKFLTSQEGDYVNEEVKKASNA